MLDQRRTPLFTAMQRYLRRQPAVFHVPGHKQGRAAPPALRRWLGAGALQLDLTEAPGLDDLHAPSGVIAEAQALAAAAFGAARSFFLVGGTTAGIHAMLLAALRPGEAVLVPRHAHRSVHGGLILAGARPVWLPPAYDPDLAIPLGVPPEAVAQALDRHPEARALVVVHPTYHGIPAAIHPLVQLAHDRGLPVLVDEAHGAHFAFHPDLPPSALAAGADAVAQSLHKTGGSLTQSSLLHLGYGCRLDPDRVQAALRLVQSTSPSYLLMASLDLARRELALRGRRLWDRALALAAAAREALARVPGVRVVDYPGMDPTRLILDVRGRGLTGYEAAEQLWRQGVAVELAGHGYLLAILSPGDGRESLGRLVAAVRRLRPSRRRKAGAGVGPPGLPPWPEVVLTPREAALGRQEAVPLSRSEGRIAAELVAPYPPGIPVLAPGERITPAVLAYLEECLRTGQHLQGPADPTLRTIRVLAE